MNMNLNELRDKAYKTACEHGFHDKELSNEHKLCLVISELMEVVKADRKGKRAMRKMFDEETRTSQTNPDQHWIFCFNNFIKDSVEDELADACIRLFDLAGLRNIDLANFKEEEITDACECCNDESFTESIYAIATLPVRYEYEYDSLFGDQLRSMILAIFGLAKHLNIDLEWYIEQKMLYNSFGDKMHGKKY